MQTHLTDIAVRQLAPGTYFDTKTPAFGIRIGKTRKTWVVLKGKTRNKATIGHYPALSLQDARRKALVALGSPYAPSDAPTFPDVRQSFLDDQKDRIRPEAAHSSSEQKSGHGSAEKACKGRSHRRLVVELAFPDNEHLPAGSPQGRDMLGVTGYVSIQLWPPIRLT